MKVTEEFLALGASERGGFSKRQTELLGLEWPLPRGWKRSVIGHIISDEAAKEFIRIAGSHLKKKSLDSAKSQYWFAASEAVAIHLYVLALANGCFYVGLTANIANRMEQHFSGKGAEWTKLHPPVRIMHTIDTGTKNALEAELMEDEATLILMLRYGSDKVRGGHFTCIEQELTETQLRSRNMWERVKCAAMESQPFDIKTSWPEALDDFLAIALRYYDSDAPADQHEAVFAACYKLTRYHYWHEDFAPCLNWQFWSRKGILPVLLSFKLGRPVGSHSASAYDVLAAALSRGRNGDHPMRRLFLLAWQAFLPTVTENQATTVNRFMEYLKDGNESDRQYDAFVSILFPEMRYLLR